MTGPTFSTVDVALTAGAGRRTMSMRVGRWLGPGDGPGRPRRFDLETATRLVAASRLSDLLRTDLPSRRGRRARELIQRVVDGPPSGVLVWDGHEPAWTDSWVLLADLAQGKAVVAVDLDAVRQRLIQGRA